VKFFLDTAFVEEIRAAKEWGILDGVTTNQHWLPRQAKVSWKWFKTYLTLWRGQSV